MATDVERLVVQLSADVKKYENALNRAMGVTNRQAKGIERRFQTMNRGVSSSFAGLGRGLLAGFVGSKVVKEVGQLADVAIKIENALKVTGLAGEDLTRVYESLRDSAMRNYAPLETLAQLYSRLGLAQKSLGVSVDEMLKFTDNVALALRVQGTTAQEARGALIQLSQAMGAGIVRAEEFNSIVEGAPSILRAAAAGLKEAGGEVSKLRKLVIDGKLSSQAFFRAFEAGAPILDKMVESANVTLSQAMTNLNNALIDTAKEFNEATGAADKFAGGINNVAQAIAGFDTSGFIEEIQKAGGVLEKFLNDVGNADIFRRLAIGIGALNEEGLQLNIETEKAKEEAATLEREVKLLQEQIALNTTLGFDNTEAIARLNEVSGRLATLREQINGMPELADMPGFNFGGPTSRRGKRRPKASDPVSIEDFPVDPDSDKKGKRKRENDYARESRQIEERIALLVAETEVMRQLDPLVEDYGYAVEKARVQQELLSAAKKAGIEVTPKLRSEIENLAEQYALASAEADKLAEAQDKARENAEKWLGVGQDVTKGFIDDLINGKSAAESFANAISKIGDALINDVLDAIFKINGQGGGLLSSIFGLFGGGGGFFPAAPGGGLYADGGYTGDGGKYQPKGVVHGGEYVFSKEAVQKAGVGNLEAMHRSLKGYASGGPVGMSIPRIGQRAANDNKPQPVQISVNVDGANGDEHVIRLVQQGVSAGLQQYDRNVAPLTVKRVVNDPRQVG